MSDVLREQADAGNLGALLSHQLELVEQLCDRVGIIRAGSMLAAGSVEELRSGSAPRYWVDAPMARPGGRRRCPGRVVRVEARGRCGAPGHDRRQCCCRRLSPPARSANSAATRRRSASSSVPSSPRRPPHEWRSPEHAAAQPAPRRLPDRPSRVRDQDPGQGLFIIGTSSRRAAALYAVLQLAVIDRSNRRQRSRSLLGPATALAQPSRRRLRRSGSRFM